MKQAAVKHHQAVLFRGHQPPFARHATNALIGNESGAAAFSGNKRNGGRKGMKGALGIGRLNKIKMKLVTVAVRPRVRPPFGITRTLGRRDGSTCTQPDAVKDLADAVCRSFTQVMTERKEASSGAVK